ncbi:MAG: acetyl-CoA acetyltransferase [Dehalococcoidia bacterium]
MGSLTKKAAIVGAYEYPLRRASGTSEFQIQAECARKALEEAGLSMKDVDGFMSPAGFASMYMAEYLGLTPRLLDTTQVGGSSYLLHISRAAAAIAANQCEVVLITYGSTALSSARAIGTGGFGARSVAAWPDSFEAPYGPILAGLYATVASRHMHDYGTTSEQLAAIAVTTRRHANMNPNALYRDLVTVEDVLNSRMIAWPLHLLDCCVISDGGGAIVVTSPERARDVRTKPVWVLGAGESYAHLSGGKRDFTTVAAAQSVPEAFGMAGVAHQDIDLLMVYDSFTITVLTTLESLGFCKKGEGGSFVEGGRLAIDGELPMNTDGGGLSSNHPGMRGIFLIIEATRQLRGDFQGTARQVKDCKIALCHGTGGNIGSRHSGVTLILGSE